MWYKGIMSIGILFLGSQYKRHAILKMDINKTEKAFSLYGLTKVTRLCKIMLNCGYIGSNIFCLERALGMKKHKIEPASLQTELAQPKKVKV